MITIKDHLFKTIGKIHKIKQVVHNCLLFIIVIGFIDRPCETFTTPVWDVGRWGRDEWRGREKGGRGGRLEEGDRGR